LTELHIHGFGWPNGFNTSLVVEPDTIRQVIADVTTPNLKTTPENA